MAENPVKIIDHIKRKKANGDYDTFYLGPQLCNIKALPTSNNNNLEEMLLMSTDKVITSWYDDVNKLNMSKIEFRRKDDTQNFYFLEVAKYIDNRSKDNIYVDTSTNAIVFGNGSAEIEQGDEHSLEMAETTNAHYDEDEHGAVISPVFRVKKNILWYQNGPDPATDKVFVSEKIVTQEKDIDDAAKTITKEDINQEPTNE